MESIDIRLATINDTSAIWTILQQAIARRKADGSQQWQDGYPNLETVSNDIACGNGFVVCINELVKGYAAIILNDEPAYDDIKGEWLSQDAFVVVHRVAVSEGCIGMGLAIRIFRWVEQFAIAHDIFSIKVDTNYDNNAMLHIMDKMQYQYCGEVHFRGSSRKAYEKLLISQ